jgi:Response regulators consisting of a CheY-like receiver domain and a winged-helix DNA-binding domain
MTHKVLLVEDERTLSGIVRDALETMDFSVELAYDGSEGLRRYFEIRPDILVVDVMMPKMSGFDMVKAIRQSDKETPILFLTAKTTVDDVVTGFNLGADDYLKKPFAIPELVVRMKTLLGRSWKEAPDQEKGQASYSIGEYQFTPESATLLHRPTGDSTLIPRREADILQLLCKGSGSIIPTQNILLSLWGNDDFFNARSLQVLITRLRHRFSRDSRIRILNVRGTGYKLIAE